MYNPEPEGLSFRNDEVWYVVLFAVLPLTWGSSALTNIWVSLFVHSCEFSTAQIWLTSRTTSSSEMAPERCVSSNLLEIGSWFLTCHGLFCLDFALQSNIRRISTSSDILVCDRFDYRSTWPSNEDRDVPGNFVSTDKPSSPITSSVDETMSIMGTAPIPLCHVCTLTLPSGKAMTISSPTQSTIKVKLI